MLQRRKVQSFLQFLVSIGLIKTKRAQNILECISNHDPCKTVVYAVSDYLRTLKVTQCFQVSSCLLDTWNARQPKVFSQQQLLSPLPKRRQIIIPSAQSPTGARHIQRFIQLQQEIQESKHKKNPQYEYLITPERQDRRKQSPLATPKTNQQPMQPFSIKRAPRLSASKVLEQSVNPQSQRKQTPLVDQVVKRFLQTPPHKLHFSAKKNNPLQDVLQNMKELEEHCSPPRHRSSQKLPVQTQINFQQKKDEKANTIYTRLYEESKIRDKNKKQKLQIKLQKEQERYSFRPTLVAKQPKTIADSRRKQPREGKAEPQSNFLFHPGTNRGRVSKSIDWADQFI